MMTQTTKTENGKNYNLLGYVVFIAAGIYFTFFSSNMSNGPLFLWLAFIFDPFDQKQAFYKRPRWQQIIFYCHVVLAIFGFIYLWL
jgi:hypothetical protein